MKTFVAAAALVVLSMPALSQQPAPTAAGPARIYTEMPAGTTVTNFYKQNVYDPSDNKIGDVDDVLIDKEGNVTAMIIGVGGFLGMGEKDAQSPSAQFVPARKTINGIWF
jgi:hypothetical protein